MSKMYKSNLYANEVPGATSADDPSADGVAYHPLKIIMLFKTNIIIVIHEY